MNEFEKIISSVQKNCDLVDALHAQEYGLCIYLLKMRDYYRWRNKINLTADIINSDIHEWISSIEEYWEEIQGQNFNDLVVNDKSFEPFDTADINKDLIPKGFVYSGGLSYGAVPLFYFAKLEEVQEEFGFTILISSQEYARGLFGPPALFRDKTIFIRKEALRHFLWSRYDEWCFRKLDNALGKAMVHYDFESNAENALEEITESEVDTVIQHEIGEGLLSKEYGEVWQQMVVDFAHTKTEVLLRAVRDLAVDCMTTLPFLIHRHRDSSIHLYFAGFSDMRKEIFPTLYKAYRVWTETGDISRIETLAEKGRIFWFDLGKEVISLYLSGGKKAQIDIDTLIEESGKCSVL